MEIDELRLKLLQKKNEKVRRVRRYCFTYHNPKHDPDQLMEILKSGGFARYVCFQLEYTTPVEARTHFQGYIEFYKPYRMTELHSKFEIKCTYLEAVGNAEQNTGYCTQKIYKGKDKRRIEGSVRKWGTPVKQGQRNDIIGFRDAIKEKPNADIRDMLDTYPVQMCLYPRFYNTCKFSYYVPYENKKKKVIFCIGDPGSGKTRFAFKYDKNNCWDAPVGSGGWFNGYAGQRVAIIDDYGLDGTVYKLTDLLKILHGHSQKVPVKGDYVIWNPEVVIITSNYHPLLWYKLNADTDQNTIDRWVSYAALVRRITSILWFEYDEEFYLPPLKCKDMEAFMYDINEEGIDTCEHQPVPHYILEKLRKKRKAKTAKIKDMLKCTEELLYDNKKPESCAKPDYNSTYDPTDEEKESLYVQHILNQNLSTYGEQCQMNEMYAFDPTTKYL